MHKFFPLSLCVYCYKNLGHGDNAVGSQISTAMNTTFKVADRILCFFISSTSLFKTYGKQKSSVSKIL